MADVPVLFTEISISFGIATAIVGVATFAIKIRQDKREFRRRQADSARLLVRDIYDNKMCMAALNMIDYEGLTYRDDERQTTLYLTIQGVLHGLRSDDTETLSKADVFVRDCFDVLFLRLEQLWSLIEVEFIRWVDLETLVGYYLYLIRRDQKKLSVIQNYTLKYGYPSVFDMLENREKFTFPMFQGADELVNENRPPEKKLQSDS